ncbi:MAG TPA: hemolysin III family protein [Candidatus Limnocylindrales bacterium]|nr:hemolysin III family protein [Candidatus Limnocylindrales bacterium]
MIADSRESELWSAATHALGVALALAALAVLVMLAGRHHSPREMVAYSIYGVSLLLLYSASTAYHGVRLPRAKRVLRMLDHMAIYLLIAGTYTPFALISLRGVMGWSIFGIIWALAAVWVVLKVFFTGRFSRTSTALYLAMGWLALLGGRALFSHLPSQGVMLLFAGGGFYTVGVLFFAFDGRSRFNHAIWHLFVLAGSVCHFFAVLVCTVPQS